MPIVPPWNSGVMRINSPETPMAITAPTIGDSDCGIIWIDEMRYKRTTGTNTTGLEKSTLGTFVNELIAAILLLAAACHKNLRDTPTALSSVFQRP